MHAFLERFSPERAFKKYGEAVRLQDGNRFLMETKQVGGIVVMNHHGKSRGNP